MIKLKEHKNGYGRSGSLDRGNTDGGFSSHDPETWILILQITLPFLQLREGAHILGTDAIGRDVFARLMYGGRTSLLVGFVSTLISCAIGVPLGLVAGYARGKAEAVIMRIADMMLAFPGLVLALAVAGIMGASIKNAIIAIVVVSWTKYARLARSLVMKIRDRDYVSAAIVTGSKTPYMLFRYMLPNALPTLIITAATDIGP